MCDAAGLESPNSDDLGSGINHLLEFPVEGEGVWVKPVPWVSPNSSSLIAEGQAAV